MFIRVELKTIFFVLCALVMMMVFYNVKRLGTKHECAMANELNESMQKSIIHHVNTIHENVLKNNLTWIKHVSLY